MSRRWSAGMFSMAERYSAENPVTSSAVASGTTVCTTRSPYKLTMLNAWFALTPDNSLLPSARSIV
jgi:hypothetical protein